MSLDVRAASVSGDRTSVTAQVGGNGFNGPSTFVFTVEDERISRMSITG